MITNIIQFLHTTAAYQAAVANLLVGEANFAANQLNLQDWTPIEGTNGAIVEVMPPPLGVGGGIVTSNHFLNFEKGRLRTVQKRDWLKKISPTATNLLFLVSRPSLLDTNSAYQLATQWLTSLSVDVRAMEQKFPPRILQIPARKIDANGRNLPGTSNNVATPLFEIAWGNRQPPTEFLNPVRVKILGTSKELLALDIRDDSIFQGTPLLVTNASQLLGPIPFPQHFVEELVGGVAAYAAVAFPEKVEAWLLTSYADEASRENAPRTKAIQLSPAKAKRFSDPLLGFDSYQWTATKMCSPDFGLKLRFTRGKEVVEFRLCYECDILEVTYGGKTKTENFDFAHNQLRKAIQSIFPNDNKVQGIEKNDVDRARKEFEAMLKSL